MCVRSDPSRCQRWLEETFSTFGAHVTEKVLIVLPAFFDEEDKIAVAEIRLMMRLLGLRPSPEQLRTLTEELDPHRGGYFLLDQSRPIFRFLADNLSSVEEVDSSAMSEAMREGHAAAKEILESIQGPGRKEDFINMVESIVADIGKLSDSEFNKMFENK